MEEHQARRHRDPESPGSLNPAINSREAITIARRILTPDEFAVWLTKHISGKGRRTGSLTLGISEDAWRYRLQQADRKLTRHLEELTCEHPSSDKAEAPPTSSASTTISGKNDDASTA